MNTAIIYYSNNNLEKNFADLLIANLKEAAGSTEIIAVTHSPVPAFEHNVVVGELPHSYKSMFEQIIVGCRNTDADVVFLAEHDVLYNKTHFQEVPQVTSKVGWYDQNVIVCDAKGYALQKNPLMSMGVFDRKDLIENMVRKIDMINHPNWRYDWVEPGKHSRDPEVGWTFKLYKSSGLPSIDIIHNRNLSRKGMVASTSNFFERAGLPPYKEFIRQMGLTDMYAAKK